MLLLLLTMGLTLSAMVAYLTSRSIVYPLAVLNDRAERLAEGDYDSEVPATNKLDEIGDLARAIEKIRDTMSAGGVRGARAQGPVGADVRRLAADLRTVLDRYPDA